MLEHLLKMISLESLVFSFKDKDLFKEFNIHHETFALRQAKVAKVSDSDLLKNILPVELFNKMFGSGNLNLLAFIFALRHKILALNSLFHLSSLKCNNSPFFKEVKNEFRLTFGTEFIEQYNQLSEFLLPPFWGKSKKLPILGFSAVGCHFVLREVSCCRAFDAYHLPYCKEPTQKIFCERHASEKFWFQKVSEEASVQAKLSQFYVDPHNFSQFDEESLKKLIADFFKHFSSTNASSSSPLTLERVNSLLNFYSFSSIEDLKKEGGSELRKRFLEMAKHCHPDKGGSQESFREVRENYEYLKEILLK